MPTPTYLKSTKANTGRISRKTVSLFRKEWWGWKDNRRKHTFWKQVRILLIRLCARACVYAKTLSDKSKRE